MPQDPIAEKCSQMPDEELLRALTIEQDEYNGDFLKTAQAELDKRGINLSQLAAQATLRFNDQEAKILPVEQICAKLKEKMSIWDSWSLTNFIGETLLIQQEASGRLLHSLYKGKYNGSFIVDSLDALEKVAGKFCRAEDWDSEAEEGFYLDDWVVFSTSRSREYIENIAAALGKFEIPFVVRGADLSRFNAIFGTYEEGDSSLKILIPEDQVAAANSVLEEIDKTIEALFKRAEAFYEAGESEKELEIYNHLAKLLPTNEDVFFNRGVILFDLKRYEEAAHSFIEAVLNARSARNVPVVEDSQAYLLQIEEQTPENIELLHALASFSLEAGNDIVTEKYYRKILSLNPDDDVAHLNLGHLYFRDSNRNDRALMHFQKYLELKPEAEDREIIETIMADLRQ